MTCKPSSWVMHSLWGGAAVAAALAWAPMTQSTVLAQSAAAPANVTFTKDVAPILQRACQECHRPGAIAPMSLLTYEEVRPWARAIKTRTTNREMPPWQIDPHVGIQKFKEDPSLTEQEIATIAKWVDSGAPMGNPADMPPARQFEDLNAWRIGKPDLIVTMDKDWVVPASGPDNWPTFILDPKLTEDRWLMAVETKPAANSHTVVHHATTTMIEPNDDASDPDAERNGGFLNEYALGKNGDIFDEGSGRLIKAGTKFRLGAHFHSNGEETNARISLGLKFYPKGYVPKHQIITQHMGDNDDLDIPANQKDVRFDGYTLLTKPAVVTSFQGHLHNRGQKQCLEAVIPPTKADGTPVTEGAPLAKVQTLSCLARWDFNWHTVYNYASDVAPVLPAGTMLHVITWFDNTAGNKSNPDPFANVGQGNRTVDEMSFAWVSWYALSDDEYKAKLAERRAQATSNNQQQQQQQ